MTEETKNRPRRRILRWRGVLGESPRKLRVMVAVILTVAGTAMTFTQLGFVSVSLSSENVGYLVVLLQVAALAALLLGTVAATAIGLATGTVLFVHALVMPLDQYELLFLATPVTIILFGLSGLVLGLLFALALRKDPPRIRRIVYIAIVSFVATTFYTICFSIGALFARAIAIVERTGAGVVESEVENVTRSIVAQLGNLGFQLRGTALLMAAICIVADLLAGRLRRVRGTLGLRTVFGAWLCVVVALAFMVMGAMSFAITTADELRHNEQIMKTNAEYWHRQAAISTERHQTIAQMHQQGEFDFDKVDEALAGRAADLLENSTMFEGSSVKVDGIIIMTIGDHVYASNDERFASPDLHVFFTEEALEAMDRSRRTGSVERFVFDDPEMMQASLDSANKGKPLSRLSPPKVAYVYVTDSPGLEARAAGEQEPLEQRIIVIRDSDQAFAERGNVMSSMTLSSFVLLLAVFLMVSLLLNRVVATRIDEENAALGKITAGDLDVRAQAGGTREFESLTEGINNTVDALQNWIAEAESRMDAELAAAKAIQEAALPRSFPPFPDIPRFDVYASMNAAKEVGGDFYDFFLVGDDCGPESGKLAFAVADVSGKGIPAALFMMKAMALIRDNVSSGMELGQAMGEANRQLCEGNDAGMFVTAWIGVLDYATGHVDFVNAGHNPPLILHKALGDDAPSTEDDAPDTPDGRSWTWLREKSGLPLGMFELPYRAHEMQCAPGDTFLIYSDGVTEAFDVEENLYGEDRLLAVARQASGKAPRELLEQVRDDVASFSSGAEQSDDITILTLARL